MASRPPLSNAPCHRHTPVAWPLSEAVPGKVLKLLHTHTAPTFLPLGAGQDESTASADALLPLSDE